MTTKQTICVHGLGYIGLPTASMFAMRGVSVLGVDVSPRVVDCINAGRIHIEEPGLDGMVQAAVASGHLRASLQAEPADVHILAVPTPVRADHTADLDYVRAAARAAAAQLRKGDLVILESTSPPRTTADVVRPILEEGGLRAGTDFFLAHCPERVLPGRILIELVHNARIIGGISPACAERAKALYETFVEGPIHLTDATTAELVKLMENTYRDVNIALANELARICEAEGVRAWDVVRLANLHPRVQLHQPGPGVGGHCISVDPWFIVERHPGTARLIHAAREINDGVPAFLAQKVLAACPPGPVVLVLGVSYKGNVDDTRESPAERLVHDLKAAGATVRCHDPHVPAFEGEATVGLEAGLAGAHAAILVADHDEFRALGPGSFTSMAQRLVFDSRAFWDPALFLAAGVDLRVVGTPGL